MPIWLTFCIGRSVHYASVGDWVDQNRRRRLRQAVLGHVQGVLGPNGVPRRCHCSDPALRIHLQVSGKQRPLLQYYTVHIHMLSDWPSLQL